jgi:16S rRNA processing protein RimM
MSKVNPKLTKIGFINKLQGYKGEVHCIIERGYVENYVDEEFLFVMLDGIAVPWAVEEIKDKRGAAVIKFENVNNEEYAKRFIDAEVFVEKRTKKDIEEPSWENLTGYEVIDKAYGSLGVIKSIEEYPQQLIAAIIIKEKEVLIPLTEDFLERVDDSEKKVYLNLPEGLIDLYLE